MRKIIASLLLASAVASSGAAFARNAGSSDSNQGQTAQSEILFRAQEEPGYALNATPRNEVQQYRSAATPMTPAQAAIAQGFAPINQ